MRHLLLPAALLFAIATTAPVHGADIRADFLKLIDRPRVAPAVNITTRPSQPGLAEFHFTYASGPGQTVPGGRLPWGGRGAFAKIISAGREFRFGTDAFSWWLDEGTLTPTLPLITGRGGNEGDRQESVLDCPPLAGGTMMVSGAEFD